MLTLPITHPELLAALGRCGHGSQVLIADGNYPHRTGTAEAADIIYLNLSPGIFTVRQVLEVLTKAIAVEAATVMDPGTGTDPDCFGTYQDLLGGLTLQRLERHQFYAAARSDDVGVVVATGDTAHYANLLLTIAAI